MSELSELAEDILCSIAVIPCTLEELIERDFLKKLGGVDQYSAWTLLNMKQKYWYEDRHSIFRIHKEFLEDARNHIFS